ncbi:hypothetical protein KIF53_17365 [Chromobacterium subtsugae]|uniref:RING-type E3 ubiquitin transferase n=1 Tax=Chromobacterium subtsugae TaxID=251747 RepID=A0ABS7FHE7_9NEIS|nr:MULTISPECIES: hypothetical protein [Chromobacterium]KUM05641.1 hypothetical protein Cv017_08030 [Chromobacterium subtsugae]KZE87285.1 hypothetical protein AWB61_13185 [Chromobacterium sp. F49]MBW7568330.1 hypothetical protein [Chromobacterium subtsugae]MBW8289406.1 hypothetical protein [Chromobacterium subtsugae]WSE93280.1 hypothetical protein U6115_08580 [Chromobacterium subtsugae]
MTANNTKSTDQPQATTEDIPLPPPENELNLANLAIPLGETILTLNIEGAPIYGILQRSRAMTSQSDYFRLQFRGYARADSNQHWQMLEGDDSRFHAVYNVAWVRVDRPSKSVTFGPKSGVSCSPALMGSGLDAFLFASVIVWAKGVCPDYAITPGLVNTGQTSTEEERLQRHAFFAGQGFQFEWQDPAQRTALYFKDKVNKLLGVWNKDVIKEFGGEDMLKRLAGQDEARASLQQRIDQLEGAHDSLKRALQKEKSTSQILTGVLVLAAIIGLWAVI